MQKDNIINSQYEGFYADFYDIIHAHISAPDASEAPFYSRFCKEATDIVWKLEAELVGYLSLFFVMG